MSLTDELRRAIQDAPLTRYELAQRAGVAESILSRFVNGHSGITLSTADKIAKVLRLVLVRR